MSDTLETYRHSGKFNPTGPVLSITAAAALGVPLGLAYAYVIRWIPFIYVNFIITLGYGLAFGWITTRLLKITRMRHTALAALCGFAAGLVALYCEWSAHIHVLVEGSPWFLRPNQVWTGVEILYQEGSWSFHHQTVSGIPLAIVWLIEAGIIVGIATAMPFTFVGDTPYCERTGCWLDEQKQINTLESFTDDAQIAALKSGDLMPLTTARAKANNAAVFTRLLLKRSPNCKLFCTLRVQDVTVTIEKDGKLKESTEDHTGDLIIPASMFELIMKFEEYQPVPPAPA